MNIIQIHSKIFTLLDNEFSGRWPPLRVDEVINAAIGLEVDDRYDNEKKSGQQKQYSFESSRKLRDQLYTLVAQSNTITASGDTIPTTGNGWPGDFNFLICPIVNISGQEISCIPLTYEEEPTIEQDPGRRPSVLYPPRVYYLQYQGGIKIKWGQQGQLLSGKLMYIKKPAIVSYGVELQVNEVLTQNNQHIAVTETVIQSYNVTPPSSPINMTISPGVVYIPEINALKNYKLISGIMVRNFVNCDLPNNMHEQVARRASALLSGIVENFDRKNDLSKEDRL